MKRLSEKRKLAGEITISLIAGMFSIVPVACGAPVLDKVVSGGATVTVADKVTDVSSSAQNNVIDWKDFSVSNGETVQFDSGAKTHNYLNIVTGAATSQIDGAIEGGKNVYIVNPNGVIFGKGASVDVGNLYVSTRSVSAVDLTGIDSTTGDMSPLATAAAANADVVNLGKLQATKVQVEGASIRFLNTTDITADKVAMTANTDGYIHVGYDDKDKKATASYTAGTNSNGNSVAIEDYQLIKTTSDLVTAATAVNAGGTANYMLYNDLDMKGVTGFTPIGTSTNPFKNKFDGMFYAIENLTLDNTANKSQATGLFGVVKGDNYQSSPARIDNVGLVKPNITGGDEAYTGGLAGQATNVVFHNVYTEDGSISNGLETGGLVGLIGNVDKSAASTAALIDGAYNIGTTSAGGGLVGVSEYDVSIKNTYSQGRNGSTTNKGLVDGVDVSLGTGALTVENSYTTYNSLLSNGVGATDSYAAATSKSASTYSGFDISNDGTKKSVWRIYEGQTLPMLTAFMQGNAVVNYDYTHGTDMGSNGGSDVSTTYNAQDFAVKNASYYGMNSSSSITQATDGLHNAMDKKAIFYSTQHGYNLIGDNLTINKKSLSITGGDTVTVTKIYDGTKSANAAVAATLGVYDADKGNVTLSGLTVEFGSKDVGTYSSENAEGSKKITAEGTATLTGSAAANYTLDASSLSTLKYTGTITPRTLYLKLNTSSGLDKTYDGTSALDSTKTDWTAASNVVIDDTKGTDHQLVSTSSGTSGSVKDDAALSFTNATANYVGTDGSAISHAGSHAVRYSGITLSGKDATNYQLVGTAGGAETIGTIDGSGTINRRVINRDSFTVLNSDGTTAVGTKVYDGLTSYDATGKTLTSDVSATGNTGVIDADRAKVIFTPTGSGTFTQSDGTTATANVSDAKNIAYGVTVSGDADTISNYKLGTDDLTKGENYTVTGDGTITPRAINISLSNAKDINKVYDGKDTVTGTGTAGSYTAFGNYVNYSSGSTSATELTGNDSAKWNITAKYDGADVVRENGTVKDNGKNVTYTVKIDNANGNYTLNNNADATTTMTGTGTITPLGVTVDFNDLTKTYDGTTVVIGKANETIMPIISGALSADTVGLAAGYTAAYNSPNVKTATTISYGNLSLTGAKAGNYELNSATVTGKGRINPKNLALTYIYDSNLLTKTYDNTSNIDNTAAAAHLKGITVDGVTVNGNPATVTYSVDQAVYDGDSNSNGNAVKDIKYKIRIKGAAGDEADNYTYGSSFTKSGDNYIVTDTNANGGQILQKDVMAVVTNLTPTRVYDADTDITGYSGSDLIAMNGLVSGDGTTNTSTAVYTDKNASSQDAAGTYLRDKSVKYTVALGNNDGNNYRLVDAKNNVLTNPIIVDNKGIITKRDLTVNFEDASKIYDTTAAVTKTATAKTDDTIRYTIDDGQSGTILNKDYANAATTGLDTGKITGTYGKSDGMTFTADENVGNKSVQYTGLSAAISTRLGDAAKNYILSDTGYGKGEIQKKSLTTGDFTFTIGKFVNTYHGNQTVLNPENFVTVSFGDKSLVYTAAKQEYQISAAYDTKNVGDNKPVNYSITINQETLGNNYELTGGTITKSDPGAQGQITPKEITVDYTGSAITKVYNGQTDLVNNTQANVIGSPLDISGGINASEGSFYTDDDVRIDKSALNAHYTDANAGKNKTIEYTISLTGGDSSNYVLKSNTLTTQGIITPKEVTASFDPVTKEYDATPFVPAAKIKPKVDGIISSDSMNGISVTVGRAVYDSSNVKEASKITYDGLALTNNGNGNYTLVDTKTTGNGSITPLALTAGDIAVKFGPITKVYDGDKNVVDPMQHFTITGKGITINYMLDKTDGAVYVDKNVGSGKNVTYKVAGISALDSTNFTLDPSVVIGGTYTTTGTITPKAIKAHVAQTANVSKIYDGTTAASKDNLVIDDGILSGDTGVVTLDWTAAYDNKNASSDPNVATNTRNVTYTLTLSGNDAGNYTLDATTHPMKGSTTENSGNTYQATGDIWRRLVYADFVNGSSHGMDKVYDGGTAVAQAYRDRVGLVSADTAAQTGIIDNDVQLSGFSSNYDSRDVNRDSNGRVVDRNVQFSGFTLVDNNKADGSDDAANYIVKAADGTSTLMGTGIISPRTINVSVNDGPIKEYDGTTAVVGNDYTTAANINVDLTNLVAGDTINVGLAAAPSYKDKNAGTGITYTYDLNWDNGNYELVVDQAVTGQSLSSESIGQNGKLTAGLTGTNGIITPRILTVDKVNYTGSAITKVYNGQTDLVNNTQANVIGSPLDISGGINASEGSFYTNDDVRIDKSALNAHYTDANAGQDKTIAYTVSLTGGDSSNYVLKSNTLTTQGTITPKGVTAHFGDVTKVYDATTTVPAAKINPALTGVLAADSAKNISVTAGSAVYNSPNVKDASTITYDGLALTNNVNGNYALVDTKTTGNGSITPLALTAGDIAVKFGPITKVYDGNQDVVDPMQHFTITGKGIAINYMLENVDGAVYDNKNAGTVKNVTYKVAGISALDSTNFTLDPSVVIGGTYTTTGTITPKAIKAHVAQTANVSKIYDGTTAASKDNLVIDDGILSGDTGVVTLDWTAAYDNKNASSDPNVATNTRDITYTLTLSGNDAGNYTLDATAHPIKGSATENSGNTYRATGDIWRRLVYADFVNGSSRGMDKVYDGGTAVAQAYRDRVGLVSADVAAQTGIIDNDVQLSGFSSNYDSRDVNRDSNGRVVDRNVQFSGFTLVDNNKADGSDDAANYIVKAADGTSTLMGTGIISPRTINVSVNDGPIKEYDGTTAVVGNGYTTAANINVDRTNLVAGDTINVGLAAAPSYKDKNAGMDIIYTYDLNWDNGNYELAVDQAVTGQGLSSESIGRNGKLTAGLTGTNGVITPRILTVDKVKDADKIYDGTADVENAATNIVLNDRIISGDTIGLTADGVYDSANASDSEAGDMLRQHNVAYTLNLSNSNYKLADDIAQGKGKIHRKELDVAADAVTVDAGDALPVFRGRVNGLVERDKILADQIDFRSDVTATSVPGEYAVYGWYSDRTSGNLGQNYTFSQDTGNKKAFTVRLTKPDRSYFDTINPKGQFTPDQTSYQQSSKDQISSFNGKPEAALEYRDRNGSILGTTTDSAGSLSITGSRAADMGRLSEIGVSKGNVVNLSSARVANTASVEVDSSGTVVNLEIVVGCIMKLNS